MMVSSAKTLTVVPEVAHVARLSCLWIRTAAGPQIGFGHLRRCLVLAQSLLDCCTPLFLIDPQDRWSQEQLKNQGCGYSCERLDTAWSLLPHPSAILIDTLDPKGLDCLMANARDRGIPVISIHDLGLNPLPSDIIIDGSIAPACTDSRPRAISYSGTDFMILDPAYRFLRQRRMQIREKIQSVLINLGGGDSHKFFPRVLEGLRLWNHEVEVVGIPGFIAWGQESLGRKDWYPMRFRWESASIARFHTKADLAITTGGLAAYEALCAGTPLFALSCDHFQQSAITAIAAEGACMDLGSGDDLDPVHLANMLSIINADHAERRLFSLRGRRMVDGRGAERVSEIIRQLIRKRATAGCQRFIE
jgi:UDP-2,4-diacetamido-2,4,6-trideoxy-beta-L-altropyranose hydrolase